MHLLRHILLASQTSIAMAIDRNDNETRLRKLHGFPHLLQMAVTLSRLEITGAITGTTPICVILEIAQSVGVDFDATRIADPHYITSIIATIDGAHITKVTENVHGEDTGHGFGSAELSFVARYVNGNLKWRVTPLIMAFRHLRIYASGTPPIPEGQWHCGQKTPDAPYNYDACMLYRLCRYFSIPTTRNSTLEEMASVVRMMDTNIDDLRGQLQATVQGFSKAELIALLCTPACQAGRSTVKLPRRILPLPDTSPVFDPRYLSQEQLAEAHRVLTTPAVLTRIAPANAYEAIMLAAVAYQVNLTECRDPLAELASMGAGIAPTHYTPVDPVFAVRYVRNPAHFNVRTTWTRKLPQLYSTEELERFVRSEGYTIAESRHANHAELLHMSRISSTFHLGWHPDAANERSPIKLEDLKEMDRRALVSYGIDDGGPLTTFTLEELAETFTAARNYTNPMKPTEVIPPRAIAKLLLLCQRHLSPEVVVAAPNGRRVRRDMGAEVRQLLQQVTSLRQPPPPPVAQRRSIEVPSALDDAYTQLLQAIQRVEAVNMATSAHAQALRVAYDNSDVGGKTQLRECLQGLMEMAGYMRAWKVGSMTFPITSQECMYDLSRQQEINDNATMAINAYEARVQALAPDLRSLFLNMPLMRFIDSPEGIVFRTLTAEEEGLTVPGRLAIMRANNNDYACIRLSSNRFLATAYYFMAAIGQPAPFDIRTMGQIS